MSGKRQSVQVVAIFPAYNEERFIGSLVLKAREHVDMVIVVDDGSTDGTAEVAKAAGAVVMQHEKNRGKGAALNTGFQKALEVGAETAVVLDADSQHLPGEIERVLSPVLEGKADIVIGSRYLGEGGAVPRHRIWGHWLFTRLLNVTSGIRITDSQSGFRAFSRRALEVSSFASTGFAVESEMQFLAQEHDLRVVEVPITIRYDDHPKRSVVAHGMMVLNGVLRLIGQYRPLLFFGVPGLLVLLAGVGWGGVVVRRYQQTQTLAVGYALLSVLLSILGSLGLFAGIILHSIRGLLISLLQGDRFENQRHRRQL